MSFWSPRQCEALIECCPSVSSQENVGSVRDWDQHFDGVVGGGCIASEMLKNFHHFCCCEATEAGRAKDHVSFNTWLKAGAW